VPALESLECLGSLHLHHPAAASNHLGLLALQRQASVKLLPSGSQRLDSQHLVSLAAGLFCLNK